MSGRCRTQGTINFNSVRRKMFLIKSCSVRLTLLVLHCFAINTNAFPFRAISQLKPLLMPRKNSIQIHSKSLCSAKTSNDEVPEGKIDWNLKGLRQEVSRRQERAFKKVAKAHERMQKLTASTVSTPETSDESEPESSNESESSISKLEELERDLSFHQEQLESLKDLDENLKFVKSTKDDFFKAMIPDIIRLELRDEPPIRTPIIKRVKQKKPSTPSGPRLPYHVYESIDGIEIRVGKGAEDNDDLSCDRAYREDAHWWMHVANLPGSHVVICSTNDNLMATHKETIIDAALLTAINSKATGGRVQVNLTRCRNVSKPRGAKAGLVQLTGKVHTVTVDVKNESKRLDRLKKNS